MDKSQDIQSGLRNARVLDGAVFNQEMTNKVTRHGIGQAKKSGLYKSNQVRERWNRQQGSRFVEKPEQKFREDEAFWE
jgi:hypothetical protein